MRKIRTTPVGGCIPHRTGAMQDAGYGLPRILLLRLSEKSRRAPSRSPTSPKTRRNSPDFAVVCRPNVRSRHHSAPFRTISLRASVHKGSGESLGRLRDKCSRAFFAHLMLASDLRGKGKGGPAYALVQPKDHVRGEYPRSFH